MKELSPDRVDSSIVWYKRFLTWLDHRWQAKSPGSHRMFRTFRSGVSGLTTDFQDFATVWTRVSAGAPYADLSYREISLLRLMPRELVRATPTLVIAALPGTVLMLPLLFYFPRVFLTEHFWTPEQRAQFTSAQLSRQRGHYASLLDDLEGLRPQLDSEPLRLAVENVRKGRPNSTELLASAAPAFEHDCLQFDYLTYRHAIHLSRCSGVSALGFYREYRLCRLAKILYEEDRAVERAGFKFGSAGDATEYLLRHQYCLARGHLAISDSGVNATPDDTDEFVRNWCSVSANFNVNRRLAFMLHLPCLMSTAGRV